ncbi:MAG TPA: TetR/AcrR family transcriptional regulator [Devosia sp.]|nr:TetR/AcrR family transcriptional regulator [Devosia sp.]
MNRPRGRPVAGIAPDAILTAALELLGTAGIDGFTMRALAGRIGVTPMAIYHHFGDRDGLIAAMADRVYATVREPAGGAPRARIEGLLLAYHAEVLRHPDLTLLILSRPRAFPEQARRITEAIARLLGGMGMTPRQSHLWVGILVDFTHGAAIAGALASKGEASAVHEAYDFGDALGELLRGLAG